MNEEAEGTGSPADRVTAVLELYVRAERLLPLYAAKLARGAPVAPEWFDDGPCRCRRTWPRSSPPTAAGRRSPLTTTSSTTGAGWPLSSWASW